MTNGDSASNGSKFLSHVTSYPVVKDSIDTVKQHPVGKKSLEIAEGAYERFGKPVEPYLETPYSYAKPYVQKADEIADSGLTGVDERFPIVKEETGTIIDTAKGYALWPYHYVYDTYSDEYRKTASHKDRGEGLNTLILAIISTQLKITSDFFQAVADFLGPKYDESKKKGADYVAHAQDTAQQYKQLGQDKLGEYQKLGQDKLDEFTQKGGEKLDEAKAKGEDAKGQAKAKGEEAKGAAQQTKEDAKAKAGQK